VLHTDIHADAHPRRLAQADVDYYQRHPNRSKRLKKLSGINYASIAYRNDSIPDPRLSGVRIASRLPIWADDYSAYLVNLKELFVRRQALIESTLIKHNAIDHPMGKASSGCVRRLPLTC